MIITEISGKSIAIMDDDHEPKPAICGRSVDLLICSDEKFEKYKELLCATTFTKRGSRIYLVDSKKLIGSE